MPRRHKNCFDNRPSTPPWSFVPTSLPESNSTSTNTSLTGTMNNAHFDYVFAGVESNDGECSGNSSDFDNSPEIIQSSNQEEFYNEINFLDYHDYSYHEFDAVVPPFHLLLNSYEVSNKPREAHTVI